MNDKQINPAVIEYCPKCGGFVSEFNDEGSYCPECDLWFAVTELEAM